MAIHGFKPNQIELTSPTSTSSVSVTLLSAMIAVLLWLVSDLMKRLMINLHPRRLMDQSDEQGRAGKR